MQRCDDGEVLLANRTGEALTYQVPDPAIKLGIETLYSAPFDRRLPGPLVEYTKYRSSDEDPELMNSVCLLSMVLAHIPIEPGPQATYIG